VSAFACAIGCLSVCLLYRGQTCSSFFFVQCQAVHLLCISRNDDNTCAPQAVLAGRARQALSQEPRAPVSPSHSSAMANAPQCLPASRMLAWRHTGPTAMVRASVLAQYPPTQSNVYPPAAQRLASVAMTPEDTTNWNSLQWRRRLERFGEDDGPIIAAGPDGEVDGICQFGELTDQGRQTTYDLGTRLRRLYVDQLKFMPTLISDADMIYLRATPIPRALESVQQTFWGMYPLTARTASFPPPTIVTRTPADETLFPNDSNCRRFAQLSRAFCPEDCGTVERHR